MVHHKQVRSLKALRSSKDKQTMDAPSFAPPPLLLEAASPPETRGNPEEMSRIFNNCRTNNWDDVLAAVIAKPSLAMTPIIMDNHISTTILHQAITSKGNTAVRANVIRQILTTTPMAASLRNGYGSLPLHVITQRNTKIKSKVKEGLIRGFVGAYRQALLEEGGTGQRTPLHIIFTDYVSPELTKLMISYGTQACFMKDKKGWLPAHVACSRHCSPEKLRMLLEVNQSALYERTYAGETILDLATATATKSHPNYALIEAINRHLAPSLPVAPLPMEAAQPFPPPAMAQMGSSTFAPIPPTLAVRPEASRTDSGDAVVEGCATTPCLSTSSTSRKKPSSSIRKRKFNENKASEALLLLSQDTHYQGLLDDDDEADIGNEHEGRPIKMEDIGNEHEGRPMKIARV